MNNILKFIIPIDSSKGLIMISYSDSRYAKYWMNSNANGTLKQDIQHELSKCFPNIDIPEPTDLFIHYWEDGIHQFKTGTHSEEIYSKVLHPMKNIHICNEAYCLNQGWIEGSLQMAKDILPKIIVGDKYKSNHTVKKNRSNFEKHDLDNMKIDLNELQKHNTLDNAWIALHGKVYDITSWVDKHPGGSIISQGLGKDSTDLWESIHGHQRSKDTILKELLPLYQIGIL